MRILVTTAATLFLALVACGSDSEIAPLSPDDACHSAAEALCTKFDECSPTFTTLFLTDRATCVARFEKNCPSSFTAAGTSSTPEQLSRCAGQARAAACDDILGRKLPEDCRTIAGTLDDGAVCGHDAQCKGRLCRPSGTTACGVCSAIGNPGATCKRDDDCDVGLKCQSAKCVAYGAVGNACSADQPCHPTLGCNAGVCAKPLAAGAACTSKAGEDPCDLVNGEYCHPITKVCAPLKTATAGGSCGFTGGEFVVCAGAGSFCRTPFGVEGTCIAPAADGSTCNDDVGPKCVAPARCTNGICTIADPAACK